MPNRKRKSRADAGNIAAPGPAEIDRERRENLRLKRELKACRQRGAEIERELGQILHDGVCQELSAVAFYVQCVQNQLDRKQLDPVPMLMEQLSACVQKSVASTHALSKRLRNTPPHP